MTKKGIEKWLGETTTAWEKLLQKGNIAWTGDREKELLLIALINSSRRLGTLTKYLLILTIILAILTGCHIYLLIS